MDTVKSNVRPIAYCALAVLTWIFTVAAAAAPLGTVTVTLRTSFYTASASADYKLFDDEAGTCSGFANNMRGARAFVLLTIFMAVPTVGIAVLDLLNVRDPCGLTTCFQGLLGRVAQLSQDAVWRGFMMAIAGVQCFFGLLAWTIMVGIPPSYCGSSSTGYKAAPFLMLVAWLFILGMIAVAFFTPVAAGLSMGGAGSEAAPPPPQQEAPKQAWEQDHKEQP